MTRCSVAVCLAVWAVCALPGVRAGAQEMPRDYQAVMAYLGKKGDCKWAAFVGTDENAAIAGDVAMLENEVTPVLKALRAHGP